MTVKIRQDNMEVLGRLMVLMSRRNDQRIGQFIYNALFRNRMAGHGPNPDYLFYIEDEDLLSQLEVLLA